MLISVMGYITLKHRKLLEDEKMKRSEIIWMPLLGVRSERMTWTTFD